VASAGTAPAAFWSKSRSRSKKTESIFSIGVTTVEAAARAGLRGIAIEAGAALVIDRAEVIAAANRTGLFVIGIQVPEKPARESS